MTPHTDLFGEPVRDFATDALGFLIAYAKRSRGQAFSPEEVIHAASMAGIQPHDGRKWGSVFSTASKEGYIRPEGLFRRYSSNGSMRPGWVGV